MYISRISAPPGNHSTISSSLPQIDDAAFMFGRFEGSAPGPDAALGQALLHSTESGGPVALVQHHHAAPDPDGSSSAFMFGVHPRQHGLPPLSELAMYLHDTELV